MIRYKAARAGVEVAVVSPQYTSQTCSRCLHLGVRPNQSDFECRDCGYQINADLNGAKSVAMRHDLVAKGRYYCEYPRKEVNRPGAVRSSEKKRQVRNLKPQAPSTARLRA
jgi:transposase